MELAAAYGRCEAITRHRAANFSYGIRLLPAPKRRALCAVYAFARRVDDVGDGDLPAEAKLELLAGARADLTRLGRAPEDPVLVALADAANRFAVPLGAFEELIEGVETDVLGAAYPTFEDLLVYCRRVAGSIGRLSLGVFGSPSPEAPGLADALGVAMQLTNILRDVVEDRAAGRTYLPEEDLARFGCDASLSGPRQRLARLLAFEAGRARGWFDRGRRLLPLLDRRSAACVGAMSGIYGRLLDRIERRPLSVLARRLSLPAWEKAWVAARSLAGAGA